jgi:uncharacterized protein YgiM (DUF1202 family)
MKLKTWLLIALTPLTAVSVLAQVSNSEPPVISPAPSEASAVVPSAPAATPEAPAAKPAHKHKAKAKHAEKTPVTKTSVILDPPVSATVKCEVLDVRGQPNFVGEVVGHVKKGDTVTVLEEITYSHGHLNEPTNWSRISLPTNVPVWVDADFIDDSNAVKVKKLNLRGGPGENYSVVGRLEKGTPVSIVTKKEGWLQIDTPTNAYAFVASQYLDKSAALPPPTGLAVASAPAPTPTPAPVVVNVPAEAPAPAPAATAPPPAPAPTPTAPAPTTQSEQDQELAALHRATAPEPATAPPAPAPTPEPAVQPSPVAEGAPRIITREGFVHRAHNIQAPSSFELHDIRTGVLTEYLQPPDGNKKFKMYIGTRVHITGTEFLDPSWPDTPVLHVQTVDLMP